MARLGGWETATIIHSIEGHCFVLRLSAPIYRQGANWRVATAPATATATATEADAAARNMQHAANSEQRTLNNSHSMPSQIGPSSIAY